MIKKDENKLKKINEFLNDKNNYVLFEFYECQKINMGYIIIIIILWWYFANISNCSLNLKICLRKFKKETETSERKENL